MIAEALEDGVAFVRRRSVEVPNASVALEPLVHQIGILFGRVEWDLELLERLGD